ncbi:MAG: hypothetical protein MI724_07045, partial [Spirochaetales bacterium]|nr:hypothetical protein [Spirochaetales bacterium]
MADGEHRTALQQHLLRPPENLETCLPAFEHRLVDKIVVGFVGETGVVDVAVGYPHLEKGEGVGEVSDPAYR